MIISDFTLAPIPVCGERMTLTEALVPIVMGLAVPGTVEQFDVERDLRCALQAHITGEHWACAMEIPGTRRRTVWGIWSNSEGPLKIFKFSDCSVRQASGHREFCNQFARHPGAHSYELADPYELVGPVQKS